MNHFQQHSETVYPVTEPAALLPFLLEHVKGKSRNNV